MEKSYDKVVQYVKQEILAGRLQPGFRLPTERELSDRLGISRNSVREGLRILQNIGVISSHQGSGNYIALNFDDTMSEVLSFMYFLKGMREEQVTEFRRIIEMDAMRLAVTRASVSQREQIRAHLEKLEGAGTERTRAKHDRAIHQILVEASRNDFLITNYNALTSLMDRYIRSMRTRIIEGMRSRHMLEQSHRMIAEGVLEGDADKGLRGLQEHFGYIEQYHGSDDICAN